MTQKIEQKLTELFPELEFSYKFHGFVNNTDRYTIMLRTKTHKETFPYFQGIGVREEPNLVGVLWCLLNDAHCAMYEKLEFIQEFGYNELDDNYRKGEQVYLACVQIRNKLEELGILEHEEELQELYQDY